MLVKSSSLEKVILSLMLNIAPIPPRNPNDEPVLFCDMMVTEEIPVLASILFSVELAVMSTLPITTPTLK